VRDWEEEMPYRISYIDVSMLTDKQIKEGILQSEEFAIEPAALARARELFEDVDCKTVLVSDNSGEHLAVIGLPSNAGLSARISAEHLSRSCRQLTRGAARGPRCFQPRQFAAVRAEPATRPRPDEILVVMAIADGGRLLNRCGTEPFVLRAPPLEGNVPDFDVAEIA
jgi:hypothetical protein